jgi:hypothetical protein
MAERPKLLSSWEADRLGFYQGTPSNIGEFVDAILRVFRSRRIPRIAPLADAWRNWEKGEPFRVNEAWIDGMIRAGHLPSKSDVTYGGNDEDQAEMMVQSGTHVIVEMLDPPPAKKRRTVMILDNVLVATREGWDRTKNEVLIASISGASRVIVRLIGLGVLLCVALVVVIGSMCPTEFIEVRFADGYTIKIPPHSSQQTIENVIREHHAISENALKWRTADVAVLVVDQTGDLLEVGALHHEAVARSRSTKGRMPRAVCMLCS